MLVEAALKKGADEAEAYVKTSKSLSVEVRGQEIDTLESSLTTGYCVRIVREGRLGFSYSTDPAKLNDVVGNALESSKYTESDEYTGLPDTASAGAGQQGVKIFDDNIISLSEKDAIYKTLAIEKSALGEDKRVKKIRKASGAFGSSETCILNSKGVSACYTATGCSAKITVIAEDGGESQMGWDYQGSRFLNDISFEQVGINAAARAVRLLGARKIKSLKGFVLLDNSVASEFLGILSAALSSDSVQKKKSVLAGRKGETVISPRLSIIDSGVLDGKLGSKPVDDEGVPTMQKALIEKGVLNGFLYNTYTARKEGLKSTGNAVRGGFTGMPSVGPANIYIEPSSNEYLSSSGGLTKAVDRGIYVVETMGMHTANPITGEFSVGVSGLWMENGEVKYPVKEAAIAGNVLELFNKTLMIGDDLRFYGNIGASSLLIEGIDISG